MWLSEIIETIRSIEGTYGLTDQPTTCPECGTRTNFDALKSNPKLQLHTCPNENCQFIFVTEEEETDNG